MFNDVFSLIRMVTPKEPEEDAEEKVQMHDRKLRFRHYSVLLGSEHDFLGDVFAESDWGGVLVVCVFVPP